MSHVLQEDRWLSKRLGRCAYRLIQTASALKFSTDLVRDIDVLPPGSFIDCKIHVTELEMIHGLSRNGFLLVDTMLTMEHRRIPPFECNAKVRPAASSDEDAVSAIARSGFSFSRFHQDPCIKKNVADDIKADWASGYFQGKRGDAMLVVEYNQVVSGFLQLLFDGSVLVIDLIAVNPQIRQRGLASAMIGYAEHHFPEFETLRVGTQLANIPALRLYEKLGFVINQAHYVLHRHIDQKDRC